jgi:hypothetical protein
VDPEPSRALVPLEAPLIALRRRRPAEFDGFPGGAAAKHLLLAAGAFSAAWLPDLLLGSAVPVWGRALLAGGLGASCSLALEALPRWLRRWRAREVVDWDGRIHSPTRPVRIVGTIEPVRAAFPLPESLGLHVYARTRLRGPAGPLGVDPEVEDLRGLPFRVRVNESTAVEVDPAQLQLLDPPIPVPMFGGNSVSRSSLCVGERVELLGRLQQVVDPSGPSAPGRGVPLVYTLAPLWRDGVWIRRRPAP